MPVRKEVEKFARVGRKDCWHPYGLQGLSPERFVMVASMILKGDFDLLDFGNKKASGEEQIEKLYRARA